MSYYKVPQLVDEIRGLDPAKDYSFEFFASAMTALENRMTSFTASNGAEAYTLLLNPSKNFTQKAVTPGLKPSAGGVIQIRVEKGAGNANKNGAFHLGSIVMKYMGPPHKDTRTVNVDFGAGTGAMPNWNNAGLAANASSFALKDDANVATGITLVSKNAYPLVVSTAGTAAPSASLGLPVFATVDSFYGDKTRPQIQYELTGLDPNTEYFFEFFASLMAKASTSTQYQVSNGTSAVTALLNPSGNTTTKAVIEDGIKPDASGKLTVTVSAGAGNASTAVLFYLGSMIVKY